jgi:RNA polymerase sigma-70 factor (ECF subfamily)
MILMHWSELTIKQHNAARLKITQGAFDSEDDFSDWVCATQKALVRFCRQFVNDWAEAEDIAQEAYIRAWQKRHSFKGGSSLLTWQMAIAKRVCLDRLRILRRKAIMQFSDRSVSGQHAVDEVETKVDVERALSKLDAKDRAILYLRSGEDYDYETIAQIMGLSQAACRKRYERAKKRFEAVYGNKES